METQNVILQGNFREAISSIQTRKCHLITELSQIDYPKWVHMKSNHSSFYSDCGGAEYASSKGIPVIVFPTRKGTQEEHKLYVEVSAALCEERIIWREDGVPLKRTKENPNDYHQRKP